MQLTRSSALCQEGTKIVEICQKGDKLFEEELAKVYKGKKIPKGVLPSRLSPRILFPRNGFVFTRS